MATVVFVDVVDSTRVASEVGDRRWRELVGAFRSAVRHQLKRFNGHEVDTAGDGFFAWFDSPANALRAAAAITADVQELGLDVRAGLHTGELEQIDGRLGGIAAHIGARVMAAAGPAQILATSTVRDLVVGGDISFEPLGEVDLKGVPGRWALHRVTSVAGRGFAKPLQGVEASTRLAMPSTTVRRRRPGLWAALVALGLVVVVTGVWGLGIVGKNAAPSASPSPTAIAQPSPTPSLLPTASPSPSPTPAKPVAIFRIDPFTNKVTVKVPADEHSHPGYNELLMDNGNLWTSYVSRELVRRDLNSGAYLDSIMTWPDEIAVDNGFGSLWVGHGGQSSPALIERIDPVNGRSIAQIKAPSEVWYFAVGDRAVYLNLHLADDETFVAEIDPSNNKVGEPYSVGPGTSGYIAFQLGRLYFDGGAVLDPATRQVVETDHPFGDIDPQTGTTWVLDTDLRTVTPWEPHAGEGDAIGMVDPPHGVAFAFGNVWVAAGSYVYRIDRNEYQVLDRIEMPEGIYARSIGVDIPTDTMWVSNCYGDLASC